MQFKKRILILCEGEKTEIFYFKGFKRDEHFRRKFSAVSIEVYHPTDHSPLGLVKEAIQQKNAAIRERNPFDHIWVVFDKDGHSNIPDTFSLARSKKINIAFSNICFEYWILLHYETTTKSFENCDKIIEYIKKYHFANYEKTKDIFEKLKSSMSIAIANNKAVLKICQSELNRGEKPYQLGAYTDVYILVEKLLGLMN
jgi:hypothetical protein